jgi:SAM-dependent methyltransferase
MIVGINLVLLIIVILIVIVAVSIIWPLLLGAAWSPTSVRIVDRMLEMAEIVSGDIVYDLGSGDGRIVVEAARKYRAKGVGIEVDPLRVIWSIINVYIMRLNGSVRIVWGNIFHQDISDATIVTLFLWQRTNQKLTKKLLSELKPGTRVVSYIWTFDDWIPVSADEYNRVYLYIIGEST